MKHLLLYLFFCMVFIAAKAQNCKTLYDAACQCKDSLPPAVYIRNGSFEDHTPECFYPTPDITDIQYPYYWGNRSFDVQNSALYFYYGCADDSVFLEKYVPLPIPDGDAVIAISDATGGSNGGTITYNKHYISTCLATPLLAGVKYRFEFYIGFSSAADYFSYSPYNFGIFGHPSCDSLPFPAHGGGWGVGCPTNQVFIDRGYIKHGWVQLGVATVAGKDGWVKAHIDFTPTENINGFIFGGDCTQCLYSRTFYFGDNFSLTAFSQLRFKTITADSGSCTNGIALYAPPNAGVKTYQWYKDSIAIAGATDSIYTVSVNSAATGNYNVRMVFADKCLVSDPFNIDLSLLDYTGFGKDTLLCYDDSLVLQPQLNNVNYLWQDGSTANRYVVKQPGNYSVQISNAEGCSVTKNIVVNFQQCAACQLYLPTAFTPNGDGLNDVFRVKTICARVDDFHLIIYNRWGQPVFESSNIDKGWDGAYHSNPMPTGTYVYVIRYKKYGAAAMQQQTGLVTLLR